MTGAAAAHILSDAFSSGGRRLAAGENVLFILRCGLPWMYLYSVALPSGQFVHLYGRITLYGLCGLNTAVGTFRLMDHSLPCPHKPTPGAGSHEGWQTVMTGGRRGPTCRSGVRAALLVPLALGVLVAAMAAAPAHAGALAGGGSFVCTSQGANGGARSATTCAILGELYAATSSGISWADRWINSSGWSAAAGGTPTDFCTCAYVRRLAASRVCSSCQHFLGFSQVASYAEAPFADFTGPLALRRAQSWVCALGSMPSKGRCLPH